MRVQKPMHVFFHSSVKNYR